MRTAEAEGAGGVRSRRRCHDRSRRWAWGGLAVVLAGGLGLRLWGIEQGLPYAYNADEADHFVPHAIEMFGHDLNPHYFANPPAYTYLLHYLFAARLRGHGGRAARDRGASRRCLTRSRVWPRRYSARWRCGCCTRPDARLFGRGVGLLAAAIEAVAFLPVFYSHLALNDVPTLAPLTLSLLGSAGVLRKGRARDHLLAGVGLGLACATKYTAGIVLVPYLAAVAARYLDDRGAAGVGERRAARGGRDRARGCRGGRRVPDREPVRDPRLRRLPRRTGPPVDAVRRSSGQAGGAQRRGACLLPVDPDLGSWLGARAGRAGWRCERVVARARARLAARAGAAAVSRVHGHPGSLLRPLAAADIPDPVSARRAVRAAASGYGRPPAAAPSCCARSRRPSRLCSRRGSCTASTPAKCSRVQTRAI